MTLATVAPGPAYTPGLWGTFFTLTGTAAATLTGLFFVAFALRVRELQLSSVLRMRARYLLTWLIAIALGSAFVLIPGQSRAALAAEILVVSAGSVAYTVWPALRFLRSELPGASAVFALRWLATAATWLLSIAAGISLLAGSGGGLYLLAFALLLGIALLVGAAWTLVVETGRHIREQDKVPGREHAAAPPGSRRQAGEDESRP